MTCRPAHIKLLSESKCHSAPTHWSQGSQPLTLAQAWCSCWAECPLFLFWAITHAASLPWSFRTLPPSLLSSAPALQAVGVCRSIGRHTWGVKWGSCLCYLPRVYQDHTIVFISIWGVLGIFFSIYYHIINVLLKTMTHTLMESCCVEEFLLSAEAEDIWGFSRAMETVGGVSLVIFFSLCNGLDLKV